LDTTKRVAIDVAEPNREVAVDVAFDFPAKVGPDRFGRRKKLTGTELHLGAVGTKVSRDRCEIGKYDGADQLNQATRAKQTRLQLTAGWLYLDSNLLPDRESISSPGNMVQDSSQPRPRDQDYGFIVNPALISNPVRGFVLHDCFGQDDARPVVILKFTDRVDRKDGRLRFQFAALEVTENRIHGGVPFYC
jgi:hypothetical protein